MGVVVFGRGISLGGSEGGGLLVPPPCLVPPCFFFSGSGETRKQQKVVALHCLHLSEPSPHAADNPHTHHR